VKEFIEESCPIEFLGRLSFIGHSLGGVIIRAALPHLEVYYALIYQYYLYS
jgi:hypothetical protein